LLKGKRVAVVTNNTGVIGPTSIVDTLLRLKVKVVKIFGPEHGFRSNTEAGAYVKNNRDVKTGLPVISLYGSNKKPTKEQLKNVDVVLYDIQDIGVRFYTYISTMCYVMEACAEFKKECIILDRPNPNGFYIDGPVLRDEFRSFLGLHNVPIVYGMTTGEYARMANEEGWLGRKKAAEPGDTNRLRCKLTVIEMVNYDRNASYALLVKPSPNIPNPQSVLLYPSLGLFEGTIVSLGRGTYLPFQVVGHPSFSDTSFAFVPMPTSLNKEPRYVNQRCYGLDLRRSDFLFDHPRRLELRWLQRMYRDLGKKHEFFEINFNYHAGNSELQEQIKSGMPESEIRKTWTKDLDKFKEIRKKYLLYPDFKS
jgi:uncharacterized protein YbbC (DUF1343 family)